MKSQVVAILMTGLLITRAWGASTPTTTLPTVPISNGTQSGVGVVTSPGSTPNSGQTELGTAGFSTGGTLGSTLGTVSPGTPVTNPIATPATSAPTGNSSTTASGSISLSPATLAPEGVPSP